MPEIKTTNVSVNWTTTQAFAVALISLLLGLAGGWFIRKSFVPAPAAPAVTSPTAPAGNPPPAPLGPSGRHAHSRSIEEDGRHASRSSS